MSELIQHECGVAALYWLNEPAAPDGPCSKLVSGGDVTPLMPAMLLDLQNRGQLAAGLSSYNPETKRGGPLLGDGTLQIIQSRLYRMISGNSTGATGALTRFSQLGITFGDGGKLSFDETKFRDAYAASPDAVATFFTDSKTGRAAALAKQIESINGATGLLKKRNTTLDDQEQLLNERIDRMNTLLDSKKQRLLAQFVAMEQALAKINTQQSALQSLGWTISTNSSSSSKS